MPDIIEWRGGRFDVDWALQEIDRIACEESLTEFLMHAWRFIDPSPFKPGWVVDALADHLEAVCDGDIRRLLINIPPRCSKSSICSIAFPAWVWAQEKHSPTSGPRVPFLHASYSFDLSVRDSVKCRRLLKSAWYRRMWGDRFTIISEQDQKKRFRNNLDGERLITSIGAAVTGEGGNIIIIDDPNAANEMLSDAVIKTTNEDWWDGTMSTRLNDPKTGAFIVVQQRLGERDLTGHILEKDTENEWTHLMLPMEYEPARSYVTSIGWKDPREKEGDLLWPERFGKIEVDRLKRDLLPWRSAGQLQQRPEPGGGGIIKRVWWRAWPPEGEPKDLAGNPVGTLMYPPCDFILAYLDTAYTEKTMNDPSALTIWGVFSGDVIAQDVKISEAGDTTRVYAESSPRVILLEAWTERLELHALVQRVAKSCGHPSKGGFNVDMLVIENKASGLSVEQEFRRLFADEPYSVILDDPKSLDKMARLYSVQPIFEEGMVYAPDRIWADAVIAQCGTFPNARHDDLVDTTSGAIRKLRNMGLLQRGSEVTAELNESLRYKVRRPKKLYPS